MWFLLYISFFYMPEYLTDIRLLYADVGLVRPADFAWTMRHPRPEAAAATAEGLAVA
jgi:hypothetical protein